MYTVTITIRSDEPVYRNRTSWSYNTDPALTEYLINATKLKNKGSNMTSNVQQVTKYSKLSKTEGACKQTADFWNYKGRAE